MTLRQFLIEFFKPKRSLIMLIGGLATYILGESIYKGDLEFLPHLIIIIISTIILAYLNRINPTKK